MTISPALRARERALARRAAASTPYGEDVSGDAHQLLMAQLIEHRRKLKDIQSVERKIAAKRAFLPLYDTWIDTTLAEGQGGRDPIVTTLLIWHIDCGLYERAVAIAEYCMRHSLDLPDQYERSLAVALIDEFATAYLRGGMPPGPGSASILRRIYELTEPHDAPDQARAKLLKATAYAWLGRGHGAPEVDLDAHTAGSLQGGLHLLERAFALWDQVGVKKDIERITRRLRQLDAIDAATHKTPQDASGSATPPAT